MKLHSITMYLCREDLNLTVPKYFKPVILFKDSSCCKKSENYNSLRESLSSKMLIVFFKNIFDGNRKKVRNRRRKSIIVIIKRAEQNSFGQAVYTLMLYASSKINVWHWLFDALCGSVDMYFRVQDPCKIIFFICTTIIEQAHPTTFLCNVTARRSKIFGQKFLKLD